jgi:nucleoside-diphosphate-sugar epimerase
MRVLVIGGAGYIGGAVTEELLRRKIDFTVYDSLLYSDQYLKPVHFIRGDVRDTKRLAECCEDYTHLIWLAAIVGDPACQMDPQAAHEVNQFSLLNLACSSDILKRKHLVFASSCSVYGYAEGELDEEAPLNPLSLYAQLKCHAEFVLREQASVILRFGTAFGRPDNFSRLRFDLAINRMAVMGAMNGVIQVQGPESWRPWVSVQDIAYACVQALSCEPSIYNVVSSNLTVGDAASEVWDAIKDMVDVSVKVDQQLHDNRNYKVSCLRAKQAGLLHSTPIVGIGQAALDIAKICTAARVADWQAPIHHNVEWLRSKHA